MTGWPTVGISNSVIQGLVFKVSLAYYSKLFYSCLMQNLSKSVWGGLATFCLLLWLLQSGLWSELVVFWFVFHLRLGTTAMSFHFTFPDGIDQPPSFWWQRCQRVHVHESIPGNIILMFFVLFLLIVSQKRDFYFIVWIWGGGGGGYPGTVLIFKIFWVSVKHVMLICLMCKMVG